MKTTISTSPYPSFALEQLLQFANYSLPVPRRGTEHMVRTLEVLSEAFLVEVKIVVETLPPAALPGYGRWLDRMISNFNCIFYDVSYDPVTDTHKVIDYFPLLDYLLLNDQNPEIKAFKLKLCHKAVILQNRVVDYLDEQVWKIHPALKEGQSEHLESLLSGKF